MLDEPAVLRPNLRPCANLDRGQRSASYSEQRLGHGYGVSGASITRRSLAPLPSSDGGQTPQATSYERPRAAPVAAAKVRQSSTGNHIGFYPFPTSVVGEMREEHRQRVLGVLGG
ncbi:MAG: hypothetical protein WAR76_14380 [Xanthobacteraceae bacterium]